MHLPILRSLPQEDGVTNNAPGAPALTGGTITFKDGNTVLGSAPLTAGNAELTIPSLSSGVHLLRAVYSAPVAAGTYTAVAFFAGSADYSAVSVTRTFTIRSAVSATVADSMLRAALYDAALLSLLG